MTPAELSRLRWIAKHGPVINMAMTFQDLGLLNAGLLKADALTAYITPAGLKALEGECGMTEEQAAVAILDRAIKDGAATMGKRHAVAMKAMLGEPRLPKEMDNAIRSILACGGVVEPEVSWQRLREHLSKPRTKTVEIWRVEWAVKDPLSSWQPVVAHYTTELAAQEQARLIQRLSDVRCICVTGPHAQEVPE